MQKTKMMVLFVLCVLSFSTFVHALPTSTPTIAPIPTATASPSPTPTEIGGLSSYSDIQPIHTSSPTPTPNLSGVTPIISLNMSNIIIQDINPSGVPLSFSPYNQSTVTLRFAQPVSADLNVTAPNADWYEARPQGGTSIVFVADGIDVYGLRYEVLYGLLVNQTIILTILSGDGTMTTLPLTSVNQGFTLDVQITTKVLPHYPTAEEQAQANSEQNKQLLNQDHAFILGQVTQLQIEVVGAIVVIIVLVVVVFLVLRHQRHTDLKINDYNAHGFGAGRL